MNEISTKLLTTYETHLCEEIAKRQIPCSPSTLREYVSRNAWLLSPAEWQRYSAVGSRLFQTDSMLLACAELIARKNRITRSTSAPKKDAPT
jgi:hypothetical protein